MKCQMIFKSNFPELLVAYRDVCLLIYGERKLTVVTFVKTKPANIFHIWLKSGSRKSKFGLQLTLLINFFELYE